MRDETTFGDRLAKAMRLRGLSQNALARALTDAAPEEGTTYPSVVNRWVKEGVLPGGRYMTLLPHILGVSADWLIAGRGDPFPVEPSAKAAAFDAIAAIVDRTRDGGSGSSDSRPDQTATQPPEGPSEKREDAHDADRQDWPATRPHEPAPASEAELDSLRNRRRA